MKGLECTLGVDTLADASGLWESGLHPQMPCFFGPQFKRRVQESTQVLRELETSLRTNHIG